MVEFTKPLISLLSPQRFVPLRHESPGYAALSQTGELITLLLGREKERRSPFFLLAACASTIEHIDQPLNLVTKDQPLLSPAESRSQMVRVPGFEPGIADPKSAALPLGHTRK
jgi:hypothetical protein